MDSSDEGSEHAYEISEEVRKSIQRADLVEAISAAQWGIPERCPCGGDIKHDVSPTPKSKQDRDTLPGSRYFTCTKFEDDGLHFRQPWVFGVEQEIEKLLREVDHQSKTIEAQNKTIEEQGKMIQDMKNEIHNHAIELARLNKLL